MYMYDMQLTFNFSTAGFPQSGNNQVPVNNTSTHDRQEVDPEVIEGLSTATTINTKGGYR